VAPSAFRGGVQLGLHEAHLDAGPVGQAASLGQGGGREVQPGDPAAELGQRHRVGPDVALEVHDVEPGDVPEAGQVEAHHLRQEGVVRGELVDVVVG
jgi:hypothetical protein